MLITVNQTEKSTKSVFTSYSKVKQTFLYQMYKLDIPLKAGHHKVKMSMMCIMIIYNWKKNHHKNKLYYIHFQSSEDCKL